MKTKVLIPGHFLAPLRERLTDLPIDLVPYDTEGVPQGDASGASVLFRWWLTQSQGDALIESYPLQWIHTGSAGVDHILTPAFLASNAELTNSAGVHAASIAEWVAASILFFEKGLETMREQQRRREWEKVERDELCGKRAVILGAGEIAQQIALRLRSFDVAVTAVRRSSESHPAFDEVITLPDIAPQLRSADWLIVALPLTRETRQLVGAEMLEQLPPRARVVNVARGEIVDTAALTEALQSKKIAGAILDVFEEEPLAADSPLWEMPDVFVLPHTTWRSPQVKEKQIALFVENLERFVRGEELRNVVDVRAGY